MDDHEGRMGVQDIPAKEEQTQDESSMVGLQGAAANEARPT
jgi:hypothetical protein